MYRRLERSLSLTWPSSAHHPHAREVCCCPPPPCRPLAFRAGRPRRAGHHCVTGGARAEDTARARIQTLCRDPTACAPPARSCCRSVAVLPSFCRRGAPPTGQPQARASRAREGRAREP
eukprot:5022338-Prymnesium_polylepis.1